MGSNSDIYYNGTADRGWTTTEPIKKGFAMYNPYIMGEQDPVKGKENMPQKQDKKPDNKPAPKPQQQQQKPQGNKADNQGIIDRYQKKNEQMFQLVQRIMSMMPSMKDVDALKEKIGALENEVKSMKGELDAEREKLKIKQSQQPYTVEKPSQYGSKSLPNDYNDTFTEYLGNVTGNSFRAYLNKDII